MQNFVENLVRSVFNSLTPDEFCSHLVLSVFSGFSIRGAAVCAIDKSTSLRVIGSYGEVGSLAGEPTGLWSDLPIARAITTKTVFYCHPPFDVSMDEFAYDWDMSAMTNTVEENEISSSDGSLLYCICLPIQRSGLVVGGLQLMFQNSPEVEIKEHGYAELTAVAAEMFFVENGTFGGLTKPDRANKRFQLSRNLRHVSTGLTPRQIQLLPKLGEKITYAQMARELAFSESTIKKDVAAIFDHLDAYSRDEAYAKAVSLGLVPPPAL